LQAIDNALNRANILSSSGIIPVSSARLILAILLGNHMKNTIKNKIRNLLAAHKTLVYLHHSHNDDRGLALAAKFEREAHDLAVAYGYADCATWKIEIMAAK